MSTYARPPPFWRTKQPTPSRCHGSAAETEAHTQVLSSLLHLRPATALCISMKMHKFLFALNFTGVFSFCAMPVRLHSLHPCPSSVAQSCRPSRGINQFEGSDRAQRKKDLPTRNVAWLRKFLNKMDPSSADQFFGHPLWWNVIRVPAKNTENTKKCIDSCNTTWITIGPHRNRTQHPNGFQRHYSLYNIQSR